MATNTSTSGIVYNSIPKTLPGNVASQGFECCSVSEFGNEVTLSASPAKLQNISVVMSSWACQSGGVYSGDCVTTPGSYFTVPITFNVYDASTFVPGGTNTPIASRTQNFNILYRPSATPGVGGCDSTQWYDAKDGACYHGLAQTITMGLGPVNLPSTVIWTVAFNTQTSGYSPTGVSGPYNSLNVGAETFDGQPSVGLDDPSSVWVNFSNAGFYCDSGAAGVDFLRQDSGCWTGYTPLAQIHASVSKKS